eukprot:PhM_4_TR19138/c1_g1_i1/m.40509
MRLAISSWALSSSLGEVRLNVCIVFRKIVRSDTRAAFSALRRAQRVRSFDVSALAISSSFVVRSSACLRASTSRDMSRSSSSLMLTSWSSIDASRRNFSSFLSGGSTVPASSEPYPASSASASESASSVFVRRDFRRVTSSAIFCTFFSAHSVCCMASASLFPRSAIVPFCCASSDCSSLIFFWSCGEERCCISWLMASSAWATDSCVERASSLRRASLRARASSSDSNLLTGWGATSMARCSDRRAISASFASMMAMSSLTRLSSLFLSSASWRIMSSTMRSVSCMDSFRRSNSSLRRSSAARTSRSSISRDFTCSSNDDTARVCSARLGSETGGRRAASAMMSSF